MNLSNFEDYIDKIILDRGYSYYISEAIINVKEEDGRYVLNVEGSEIYTVRVKINENGGIEESICNCPFDFGPICKHEVAAYYYLRDLEKMPINNKENVRKSDIQKLLMELPKEELIKIITQITSNDRNLEQSIIYQYSNYDEASEIIKFKELLNSLVDKYTGYDDFIVYSRVHDFAYDMSNLLVNGIEKALKTSNYLLTVDIILILMEEALEAFQYADDSGGDIGMLIGEITDNLDDIIIEVIENNYDKKEEVFNKLLKYIDTKALDDWQDYRINLLNICFRFIEEEKYRQIFTKKLKYLINKEKCEFSDYYKERILMMLYELVLEYESEEKANLFVKENLKYTSFRELLINKLKDEGNYSKIIDLALEGEKKDNNLPGLVNKWKKIRYEAYKNLSLKEEQEKLARELLLDGNFEYYEELKAMNKDNKEILYNEIINQIQKGKEWYWSNLYVKLIVYEKDMKRILDYVKNNPMQIETYVDMLINEYPDEVNSIYKDHIFSLSKSASDRKKYRNVCRVIEKFKKYTTIDDINNIISKLKFLNKNRPAFMDELSKIRK